ncbi:MAG: SH3 domain-containing protein [Spirochaetales bacterium]|nr:SH3 domain-containing protein [Spirochaetales bacterium]
MNKYLLLYLVLFFVATALSAQSPESISESRWITADIGLRIRKGPGLNYEKIGLIPFAEKVMLLEETGNTLTIQGATGKWSKIDWHGTIGWVFGGFLTDDDANVYSIIYRDNSNCNLWISDVKGTTHKKTNLKPTTSGGCMGKGDRDPILSPDQQKVAYLKYISGAVQINIYTIPYEKSIAAFHIDFLPEDDERFNPYESSEILISGWTADSNFLLFHAYDLSGETKEGFYLYNVTNASVRFLDSICSFDSSVARSNNIICTLHGDDSVCIFDIKSEKKIQNFYLPDDAGQLHVFKNLITYTRSYAGEWWEGETGSSKIVYKELNAVDETMVVDYGDWAEYQFPHFVADARCIVYIRHTDNMDYIYLYDVKNKTTKKIYQGKYAGIREVKGDWVIINHDKSIYSYNCLTNEKIKIADDVWH